MAQLIEAAPFLFVVKPACWVINSKQMQEADSEGSGLLNVTELLLLAVTLENKYKLAEY